MVFNLFRELILISVGEKDSLSSIPTGGDWLQLFKMAKKQALLGVCFGGIQRLYQKESEQLASLPAELKTRWMGSAVIIQCRNELMNARCVELQRRFSDAGLKSCILKGQGVASFYDSLASFRQSGDIDVFVDADRVAALDYLKNNGIACFGLDYVHAHPLFFNDVEVELHYRANVFRNLVRNRKFQRFVEQNKAEFFSGSVELADVGSIVVPSGWMNLFYQLHHIYRHLFSEGIGLRQVMDYFFSLKAISLSDEDTKKLLKVVKAFGMERFARGLMWVLVDVFNMGEDHMLWQPDVKEGQFILNDILNGGNFGQGNKRCSWSSNRRVNKFADATRRSFHLVTYYPSEALWTPVYYLWHFCWKRLQSI